MYHQMESVGSYKGLDKKAAIIGGFFAFGVALNRVSNGTHRAAILTSNSDKGVHRLCALLGRR